MIGRRGEPLREARNEIPGGAVDLEGSEE